MLGGLSDIKECDETIINIVKNVKNNFEEICYSTNTFEVVCYRTQVVAGTNYFTKVKTDKEYVHLRIFNNLDNVVTFVNHQLNKKENDTIEYF